MTKDANFSMPKVGEGREDQTLAKVKVVKKLDKKKIFADANYPYDEKMDTAQYEMLKQQLQIELLKMQNWVKDTITLGNSLINYQFSVLEEVLAEGDSGFEDKFFNIMVPLEQPLQRH